MLSTTKHWPNVIIWYATKKSTAKSFVAPQVANNTIAIDTITATTPIEAILSVINDNPEMDPAVATVASVAKEKRT